MSLRRLATLVLLGATACGGAAPRGEVPAARREIPIGTTSPDEERKILEAVDRSTAGDMVFWKRIVDINSGTMNFEGVREMGTIFREELDKLGFKTRWVPQDEMHRAGHLVAEHESPTGPQGRRVLLIGHLDTVFEPSSPFQKWSREGDSVVGPGVNDMKGGLVVMLSALRAMAQAGTLANANIIVVLTGDEEKAGSPFEAAKRELLEAGKRSDVAMCFEATLRENGHDIGTTARRGSTSWTLEVSGTSGHSSGIFGGKLGAGAIFETARILDAFYRELREPNLTYSAGLVLGGTEVESDPANDRGTAMGKSNVVPDAAVVRGDLRALTPDQLERTKQKMRAIVGRHLPRTDAKIAFHDSYPPMAPTPGNRALLARLNDVNRTLGEPEEEEGDPLSRGAGDIAVVSPFVDSLSGLGMSGHGAHAPGEAADAARLPVLTKRAALFIYRLTRPVASAVTTGPTSR
jgi:glutamate carboxypeptidase